MFYNIYSCEFIISFTRDRKSVTDLDHINRYFNNNKCYFAGTILY